MDVKHVQFINYSSIRDKIDEWADGRKQDIKSSADNFCGSMVAGLKCWGHESDSMSSNPADMERGPPPRYGCNRHQTGVKDIRAARARDRSWF